MLGGATCSAAKLLPFGVDHVKPYSAVQPVPMIGLAYARSSVYNSKQRLLQQQNSVVSYRHTPVWNAISGICMVQLWANCQTADSKEKS
jgi:hypothetical protein